jgi:hypothetical protein
MGKEECKRRVCLLLILFLMILMTILGVLMIKFKSKNYKSEDSKVLLHEQMEEGRKKIIPIPTKPLPLSYPPQLTEEDEIAMVPKKKRGRPRKEGGVVLKSKKERKKPKELNDEQRDQFCCLLYLQKYF